MNFKRLVLEYTQFEEDSISTIVKAISKQCEKYEGPMKDIEDKYFENKEAPLTIESMKKASSSKLRRDKESVLRDLMTAVAVCHNVTPLIENGEKIYHASSPDEIALVRFAQDCKMKLIERNNDYMKIENAFA